MKIKLSVTWLILITNWNEYNKALELADDDNKKIIAAEIEKQNDRKEFYNNSLISY